MSSCRVLVVCEANLLRSPLTAALLALHCPTYLGDTIEVESAGTHAQSGMPAPAQGRALARKLGADLENHRSRQLTRDQMHDSDLVLTMTERQRDDVQRLAPNATMRTFTLIEFVRLLRTQPDTQAPLPQVIRATHAARPRTTQPAVLEDIEDPLGHHYRMYAKVGKTLADLVSELAALLGSGEEAAASRGTAT